MSYSVIYSKALQLLQALCRVTLKTISIFDRQAEMEKLIKLKWLYALVRQALFMPESFPTPAVDKAYFPHNLESQTAS